MPETVPDGFGPHVKKSKVTDPWEPLYSRELPEAVQIGLRLRDEHCNSRGFVRGGVSAALADNAMGLSFVRVFKATVEDPAHPATGAVTVGLGVDYVATAKL